MDYHRHVGVGVCLAGALAAGCADLNDTGMSALATRVTAFAIVNDQLLQGEMTLFPDHTGTLTLRTPDVPGTASGFSGLNPEAKPGPTTGGVAALVGAASCVGRMRYASTTLADMDLRCHDGSVAPMRLALIGETRGYGYGQTANGLASVTFGLRPAEARAHLTVPRGRQLVERTDSDGLELR